LANLSRLKIPSYALNFQRIIWVRRRDVIEQAVSLAIALQTGAWTSFHKPSLAPRYNYQAIVNCAKTIKLMELKWTHFLSRTNAPHLSLFYEDIRGNEVATVAKILQWFGLPMPNAALSVPLQKQATETNAVWKDRFLCEMRRQ
jgi:LPS sulfotransferase NodH